MVTYVFISLLYVVFKQQHLERIKNEGFGPSEVLLHNALLCRVHDTSSGTVYLSYEEDIHARKAFIFS